MRPPTIPREEVIERLARVFRAAGFDRATLTELSRQSGLQRSSLYHLFPGGKAEMAMAVIDHSNDLFAGAVLSALEGPQPPRQRFRHMIESIDRYYKSGREACLLGSFALEMPSDQFGAAIRAGFLRWIELLAKLFRESGLPDRECPTRAREIVAMIQGALVVSRGLESKSVFGELLRRLPARAFEPVPQVAPPEVRQCNRRLA